MKLILQQTLEEFNIRVLEICHDSNSFFGTIKLETEIDLYGNRYDDPNKFYIKIQEANRKETYYLKFLCDRDEKNYVYYFEGINWTTNYF